MLTPVTQVPEGAQVRLQCSVIVPCPSLPPSITWLLGNDSIHGQEDRQHVTFMAEVRASPQACPNVYHPSLLELTCTSALASFELTLQ